MDLNILRQEIDEIDQEMIRLFQRRLEVAEGVAKYKISVGKQVYDAERERAKIERSKTFAHNSFNAVGIETLMRQMMAISRVKQYELIADHEKTDYGFTCHTINKSGAKVVFQGVEGAYGHQAMLGYFGENVDGYHVETFEDVMLEVKEGRAEYGVLPVENSSTGIITDVYDLMTKYNNYIVGEYVVKVEHALLGLETAELKDIKTVYSHPQGLMQCSDFLSHYPEWEQVSLKNTAVSALKVVEDQKKEQAAVASKIAAKCYGLKVLQEKINDIKNNSTRFIVIASQPIYEKEANGISITFELAHETGSLYHALGFIIYNDLNMTKIESRPIKGEKWKYRFFIDFDGDFSDSRVRDALKGIEAETINFKILGNYKKAE